MQEVDFASADVSGANLKDTNMRGAKNMHRIIGLDRALNLDQSLL